KLLSRPATVTVLPAQVSDGVATAVVVSDGAGVLAWARLRVKVSFAPSSGSTSTWRASFLWFGEYQMVSDIEPSAVWAWIFLVALVPIGVVSDSLETEAEAAKGRSPAKVSEPEPPTEPAS